MKSLLAEYLQKILVEEVKKIEQGENIPQQAVGHYRGKFGNVYADPQLTQYLGKIKNGQWVPAAQEPASTGEKKPRGGKDKMPQQVQPTVSTQTPADQVFFNVYGQSGTGPLLQGEDSDAQKSLELGYVEKAEHVAPGNAGSNFNENMSNEGVLILERHPTLSEEELSLIIYRRTKDTELGRQVNRIRPQASKIKFPPEVKTKQEKDAYSAALIAARSAMSKRERSAIELDGVPEETFGSQHTSTTFGGTKKDLANLSQAIQSGQKIYMYDEELGLVEIPKEEVLNWVSQSGGGENAADTVVLTTDENGNILFQGWSDKTTLADIQGNSSLNKELSNIRDVVDSLLETGQITKENARKALDATKKFISSVLSIENGYTDVTRTNAQFFLELDEERMDAFAQAADRDSTTTKHFNNFRTKIDNLLSGGSFPGSAKFKDALTRIHSMEDGESEENYFQRLTEMANLQGGRFYFHLLNAVSQEGLTTKDENKVIVRLAAAERRIIQERGEELPESLDTRRQLSRMRQSAVDSQRELYRQLDTVPGESRNGEVKSVGELVGFTDALNFFHLDKIDSPSDSTDVRQIMRRNTQLAMEGIAITPNNIRECLGVSSTREMEDQFKLSFEERYTYKDPPKNTIISGKVVIIYALDREGKQVEVGQKSYRTKDSETGKTQTTIEWSKNMQDCFSKRGVR